MLFSIFTYITFALILTFLAYEDKAFSSKNVVYRNHFTIYSWIFIFVFTIVSAFRYNLGADCESYVEFFKRADFRVDSTKNEFLFYYISDLLYGLGFSRVGYLGFWAFWEILFVYAALQSRKYLLPFFAIVLVLGPHYYDWMNGIRQMIATCIFIYGMQQRIDNNRFILLFFLIYLATFFHHSAIMLFIFVVFPNFNYFSNRYVTIGLILACAILGQAGWIKEPLNMLSLAVGDVDSGYEGYTSRMGHFTEELGEGMGYGPRRLIILLVSLLCVWFYPNMKKKYNDNFLLFCYTSTVITAMFPENILSSVHSSLSRPFLYFKPLKLIFNAYLLYYIYQQYIKKYPIFYYSILLLSVSYMILDSVVVAGNPNEATLFKFIFLR